MTAPFRHRGGAPVGQITDLPPVEAEAKPAPPPVTMDDVTALTGDSDFRRFVRHDVDGPVRNAALKKLFTDPHYNVMDGLDTYIDDYNRPDPLPASMLSVSTPSVLRLSSRTSS